MKKEGFHFIQVQIQDGSFDPAASIKATDFQSSQD